MLYSSRMTDAVTATTTIEPGGYVRGTLRVPGDKSISHRYAILATLAEGQSSIHRYAPGADCAATLSCLQSLGADIESQNESQESAEPVVTIDGTGPKGLQPVTHRLDAGNSGTTMRLIAGVLAAHPFDTTIIGDGSLSRRPMRRIVDPLERMGARVETRDGCPPLIIRGTELQGLDYEPPSPARKSRARCCWPDCMRAARPGFGRRYKRGTTPNGRSLCLAHTSVGWTWRWVYQAGSGCRLRR